MNTFEQLPQSDDKAESSKQNPEKREMIEITNTKTFQETLEAGYLKEATTWLENAKSDPKYDERWLDHRSGELMSALCDAGQLDEAKKYIDDAENEKGRRGRKEKIERLQKQSS